MDLDTFKKTSVRGEQLNALITELKNKVMVAETKLKGIEYWGLTDADEDKIKLNLSVWQPNLMLAYTLYGKEPLDPTALIEGVDVLQWLQLIKMRRQECGYKKILFGQTPNSPLSLKYDKQIIAWTVVEQEFMNHFYLAD
jgi:hypothetical protein